MSARKRGLQSIRTAATVAAAAALGAIVIAPSDSVRADTEIFRDDFNAASLDTSAWSTGNWSLDRTQLGFTPVVSGGSAQLRLDTYNPANPGGSFKGSEIYSNLLYTRGSGIEFEARVKPGALPSGLVTSFFTYNTTGSNPPLADEMDFEFLSTQINNSNSSFDPVLATTWNNYKTDGSNFGDPNVHSSENENVAGLDLTQYNTIDLKWLPDRVEWYVNGTPIRTSLYAVPDLAAPIRANFWAPGSEWGDAYSAALNPVSNSAQNTSYTYNVDYISVKRLFDPVATTGTNRVFTDNFNNGNVANSNSISGFWTQRNINAGSTVQEGSASPANAAAPLQLTANGGGYPQGQIASPVRSEFNFFRTPISLQATGIGFSSTSNSTTVNTISKSILRFVLSSQTLANNTDSEYTSADCFAVRIEGGNLVALGYKLNAPNTNTEYSNNLLSTTMSGPVRAILLTLHPTYYSLQVTHDLSNSDSTQTINTFTGSISLNLSDWSASGDSAMYVQGQLNNSGANENMTALVGSLAVSQVKPAWNINGPGNWSTASNWTDQPAPNYRGAFAQFTSAITAPRTVAADVPITVGTLSFDNAAPYTIAGAGPITLSTYVDNPLIQVITGTTHTIAAPINLTQNTSLDVAQFSSITLSGNMSAGSSTLTKTSPGTASLKNIRGTGGLTVNAGRLALLQDGTATGVSKIGALTIAANAQLDLGNNHLITSSAVGSFNGSQYTGVAGLIQSGRGAGNWLGATGMITTQSTATTSNLTSIGVARASDLLPATATATGTWGGQTITGTDTLVMYTYGGDATLDGKINVDDYIRIDSGVAGGLSGWSNGDFNYDGKVNIDDYTQFIDANIGNQGSAFFTAGGAASTLVAVPEPLGCALLLTALPLLRRRRRFVRPSRCGSLGGHVVDESR